MRERERELQGSTQSVEQEAGARPCADSASAPVSSAVSGPVCSGRGKNRHTLLV